MLPFLGGDIKVGKYAINGSKEVADYTVIALQDRKAALMANHGAVAAGASLQDAVTSAIYLEDAAKICSLARLHGNVQEISSPADKHSSMENDAKKDNNMPPSVSMADYSAYNIDSIDMTGHNINDIDTVYLDDKTSSMVLIDQTLLPNQTKIISLRNQKDIWRAINILQVRGAPAIGVAAAIGIYLAAKRYNIPFYVCAPTSTIDMATPTGSDITIEERDPAEVTSMWYEKPMAPEDVKVYNPAFDVTDADLITAIVTEEGIIYPPYKKNLATLMTR